MNNLSFQTLPKLKPCDKVAIVSPSYAAPGRWPHIYELGVVRLRDEFGLIGVSYPATAKLGASAEERSADLVAAFRNPEIKAVIASLGGDDQVTYVKNLPPQVFVENPKPFLGYSDNTHFADFLWRLGVPSFYGGSLFTEFARTPKMDPFTVDYLKLALFGGGLTELSASPRFNDIGTGWDSPDNLTREKFYEPSEGWRWDGSGVAEGVTWGGCLESLDEILRHCLPLPSLDQFEGVILFTETSEEIPSHDYVRRFYRALGERGVLARLNGILVGRPKAWEFGDERSPEEKAEYRRLQRKAILETVRAYNPSVPVVQNMDFGHTSPQICLPYGSLARVDADSLKISVSF